MDYETVRTAIGLRLGSALCPHPCLHCGQFVDELGVHGLSCRYSKGRNPCHSALNDVIEQSLSSINIPSTLEPRGLCLSNDSRPDGVTIIPWSQGRCLAWDATCHYTFAPTNLPLTCTGASLLANRAAQKKQELYSELVTSYTFMSIALETTGAFSDDALTFSPELGKHTKEATDDPLSYHKLCDSQRISVTVQKFNYIAIGNTCMK